MARIRAARPIDGWQALLAFTPKSPMTFMGQKRGEAQHIFTATCGASSVEHLRVINVFRPGRLMGGHISQEVFALKCQLPCMAESNERQSVAISLRSRSIEAVFEAPRSFL
jgi:hypothetical protein